jgi:RNA polymerase sigma-70 factor (ECF subfamily)
MEPSCNDHVPFGPVQGLPNSMPELISIAYADLHTIAKRIFRNERSDHTLQPTAVLHESLIRLFDENPSRWKNLGHFYCIAARTMRRVLVDHARAHNANKRKFLRVELTDGIAERPLLALDDPDTILAVNDALIRLAEFDSRQAEIAELRFFGGLTIDEAADTLGLKRTTVKDDWKLAKAWLRRELE